MIFQTDYMVGKTMANRYLIRRRIGWGSFGTLHICKDNITGEELAIKLEPVGEHNLLEREVEAYRSLAGCVGIPSLRNHGKDADFNFIILDICGSNLEDLFNQCNRRFSLKTVLMLADQLITRFESIHSRDLLHRDIKPQNFLVGHRRSHMQVKVVDFGLAKRYRTRYPGGIQHMAYRNDRPLFGTVRFASMNSHLGAEPSRRDDMEALGYLLLYFLRGSLPWQGLEGELTRDEHNLVRDKKMNTPVEELCRGLPDEFKFYIHYVRSLRFDDRPDYSRLRRHFQDLFDRQQFQRDYCFDWVVYSHTQARNTS